MINNKLTCITAKDDKLLEHYYGINNTISYLYGPQFLKMNKQINSVLFDFKICPSTCKFCEGDN
jgi:hypothetical protein